MCPNYHVTVHNNTHPHIARQKSLETLVMLKNNVGTFTSSETAAGFLSQKN